VKKLLLVVPAVAAAIGLPMVANAAAVEAGTQQFSREYSIRAVELGAPTKLAVRANDETVASTNARFPRFQLSAAVNTGDVVTLTLGGTAGAQFSTADNIRLYCDSTNDENPVEAGKELTAAAAPTATGFSATTTANCAADKYVYVTGGQYAISSLQTVGTITMAAQVTRAGSTVDNAVAAQVGEVVQELNVAVQSAYAGTIDNRDNNKQFASDASSTAMTLRFTNVDVFEDTDVTPATDDAVVFSINGDFNYLDEGAAAGCADTDLSGGQGVYTAASGTLAINSGCSTITITNTNANTFGAGASTDIAQKIRTDAAVHAAADVGAAGVLGASNWLVKQTFTGSAVIKYTAAASAIAQTRTVTLSPGVLTGNGSTVFVPYLPIGSGISQILYLTNTANVAGTITMSARNSAGTECPTASFGGNITVAARRVTNLASALSTGIAACGGASTSDKWYLTITADLPDGAIEVYSAYNVGGSDRANVINSSNGRVVTGGQGSSNSNGNL